MGVCSSPSLIYISVSTKVMSRKIIEAPLLVDDAHNPKKWTTNILSFFFSIILGITFICLTLQGGDFGSWIIVAFANKYSEKELDFGNVVQSGEAVVAADDGRCSEIGASVLREGGHAVDASVATAFCLGVVNPMASGIGGGGFMIVRSSATLETLAFNMKETAPLASTKNMYENNPHAKYAGALSMGVPGEVAGLYEAWSKYGRMSWRGLLQPAIKLAKDGFVVAPFFAKSISVSAEIIKGDPGLRQVYAPNGKLLQAGDTCYSEELGRSLEAVAEQGPEAFYNGKIGEKLVNDVKEAGGILSMEDLRNYKVDVTDAVAVNTMGYTILGVPAPSTGALGLALVLNILDSYGNYEADKGALGLHRFVEALKHMFAVRMNLGDPDFENISGTVDKMLSPEFAKKIQKRILDNTTFPSEYYMHRWSQLRDHGTSHFCIVDADRNAVSSTTSINYFFGGGILSPSTGIVLNNQMDDFSTPTELSPDKLPPAPTNFIEPNKRPLSSMTAIIVLKEDGQLAGVIGGSGGMKIIPAVAQVFINHFILGMKPSAAVEYPRVYHTLIPNVVTYENWTVFNGYHIELPDDRKRFLEERGHELEFIVGGTACQLVTHTLETPTEMGQKNGKEAKGQVLRGILTAVSDPRKDGKPAAV